MASTGMLMGHLYDTVVFALISYISTAHPTLQEYLTKEEMLRYSKTGLIPTSHIRLHDAENIHQACMLFKVNTSAHVWSSFLSCHVQLEIEGRNRNSRHQIE